MKYKITKLIQETIDTRTFRLVPVEGKVMDFVPGQFVMLTVELEVNGRLQPVKRAYSMSSTPDEEFIALLFIWGFENCALWESNDILPHCAKLY